MPRGELVSGHLSTAAPGQGFNSGAGPDTVFSDHVLKIGDEVIRLDHAAIEFRLPTGVSDVKLELRDGDGALVARGSLPLESPSRPSMPDGAVATVPAYCSSTGVLVLPGSFDGSASTTRVLIGDEPVQVWTESRTQALLVPFNLPPGRQTLRLVEAGRTQETRLNVLRIEGTPTSSEVEEGEAVHFRVVVDGLDGLDPSIWPIFAASTWILDGGEDEIERRWVLSSAEAIDGRIVLDHEVLAPAAGTLMFSGGVRPVVPPA